MLPRSAKTLGFTFLAIAVLAIITAIAFSVFTSWFLMEPFQRIREVVKSVTQVFAIAGLAILVFSRGKNDDENLSGIRVRSLANTLLYGASATIVSIIHDLVTWGSFVLTHVPWLIILQLIFYLVDFNSRKKKLAAIIVKDQA